MTYLKPLAFLLYDIHIYQIFYLIHVLFCTLSYFLHTLFNTNPIIFLVFTYLITILSRIYFIIPRWTRCLK